VEEQIKLLRYQRKLEDELGMSVVDSSLQQTLHKLTLEGSHMHAEKLRKEFKVPDKRWAQFGMYCQTLAEWSEGCASVPKVTGSNPSGGSKSTFCSDLLLTARGSCT
jgi:hypothetical protein